MLNKKWSSEALDKLLHARRQHTLWVSEVMNQSMPRVAEDHTQCDFGKWIHGSGGLLMGEMEGFQQMVTIHKELHQAYSDLKDDPNQHERMLREIKQLSNQLFDQIDLLEATLQQTP